MWSGAGLEASAVGAALAVGLAVWLVLPSGNRRMAHDQGASAAVDRLSRLVPAARRGSLPLRARIRLGVVGGIALGAGSAWIFERWWVFLAAGPVVAAVAIVGLGQLESSAARAERVEVQRDLPQALELMAAVLDAGLPMRTALQVVAGVMQGPLRERLDRVLAMIELGESESVAWRMLGADPDVGMAARDLARSADHGIPVAEVLAAHAEAARSERHAVTERAARTVGVSAVLPLMICFLPAFVLIGIIPIIAGALLPILGAFGG